MEKRGCQTSSKTVSSVNRCASNWGEETGVFDFSTESAVWGFCELEVAAFYSLWKRQKSDLWCSFKEKKVNKKFLQRNCATDLLLVFHTEDELLCVHVCLYIIYILKTKILIFTSLSSSSADERDVGQNCKNEMKNKLFGEGEFLVLLIWS